MYAGATVAAWYPITPATSVMDGFKSFCEKFRKDPATGKRNFCILQAEDELAAVGMVIGASWNGARAFTSTAGPGISLMSELLGLAYYAEIPAVVIDVQRTGPSTGMPTRTQQADILACAYASHGDTKHILLFPANPSECFHMAKDAFDLAERFQTPVIMLSDLDIGMNDWVTPRLTWDDSYRPNRGKVLTADELEAMAKEGKKFFRYSPADADNVAARTRARRPRPRGVLHPRLRPQQAGRVHRDPRRVPGGGRPAGAQAQGGGQGGARRRSIEIQPGARIGVVSLGGCDPAVREGVALLAAKGVKVDYLRVRGFPFDDTVEAFLNGHDTNIVDRAEPGRAAAHPAGQRDQRGQGEAAVAAGLRRLPAVGPARGGRRHEGGRRAGPRRGRGPRRQACWRPPGRGACVVSKKPSLIHPQLRPNKLGLTLRDYEGAMSTLCAGCGHDSVTAAIVRAFFELDTPPHMVAKLSGIGCSSKTPTYFLSGAHGFNRAHGRMPAIAAGAAAANREPDLHRHLGRRRLAVHRPRPAVRTPSGAT